MEDCQKMDFWIAELIPNIGHQYLSLFNSPSKNTSEGCKSEGFDTSNHVFSLISADFFQLLVFGPWSDGDLHTSISLEPSDSID